MITSRPRLPANEHPWLSAVRALLRARRKALTVGPLEILLAFVFVGFIGYMFRRGKSGASDLVPTFIEPRIPS